MSRQIDDLCILNRALLFELFPKLNGDARVAIIGNGPVYAEDAAIVAGSDLYVRFNNWGSRTDLQGSLQVVGGACDIVFGNMDIHTTNQGTGGVGTPRLAVQAIPYPHRYRDADALAERWYPTAQLAMANPFWVRDLCHELGLESEGWRHPLPTVGITGLYSFWRMALDTQQHRVEFRVAGFNWHYDPERNTYDGIHPSVCEPPPGRNHYYLNEARWCARRLSHSPRWVFTSRAQAALEALR